MNPIHEIEPELMKKLTILKISAKRDPEKEKKARAAFLQEAQVLSASVTVPQKQRHNGWTNFIQSLVTFRKEQNPMLNILATIILVVTLVFGGGGVAVAAAENSLPETPLYGFKLWMEDARWSITTRPESQYELSLENTNQRAEEARLVLQTGKSLPDSFANAYQNQVEQTIQAALNLPENQVVQALEQIRTHLQNQERALDHILPENCSPQAEASLVQVRQMLVERSQWVEEGLVDPAKMQIWIRQRDQQNRQYPQSSNTPSGQNTQEAPGTGNGNPWTTGTPTPGSGYGPGNGDNCTTCTPAENGQGNNPWTTGTPTPGSGYGPGNGGDGQTCTPVKNGDGSGGNPWVTGTPVPGSGNGNGDGQGSGSQSTPQQNPATPSGPGQQSTSAPGGPGGNH